MHYQFFFPGKTSNAGSCLRSVGLADFAEGATEAPVRFGEEMGLLVSWGDVVGLDLDHQRWIDSGDGYRIGFWNDNPPTPDDLRRGSLFAGYDINLADGNDWRVPVAAQLPANFRLVSGNWTKVRKPQFEEFWRQSSDWYRRFTLFGLDPDKMVEDAGISSQSFLNLWMQFCLFALQQNYRLTPLIASEMGLLDTQSQLSITLAVVDGMMIQEVLDELERMSAGSKKNDSPTIQDS